MGAFINMVGRKYNRLMAISIAGKGACHKYLFRCDCGVEKVLKGYSVRYGQTKSCGCLKNEKARENFRTHGLGKSSEYSIWISMKQRCYNKNSCGYKNYGGRGISVCDKWVNNYAAFLQDMGARPDSTYSIERRNNDGNYEPENCYWLKRSKQGLNKRNSRRIVLFGEKKCIREWCNLFNLRYGLLEERVIKIKWPIDERIVCKYPVGHRHSRLPMSEFDKKCVISYISSVMDKINQEAKRVVKMIEEIEQDKTIENIYNEKFAA